MTLNAMGITIVQCFITATKKAVQSIEFKRKAMENMYFQNGFKRKSTGSSFPKPQFTT